MTPSTVTTAGDRAPWIPPGDRAGAGSPPGPPLRVVVLTASVGAGHDGPARRIAERLVAAGHHPEVVDLVDLAPVRSGVLLRAVFHAQLTWAPGSWGRLYTATDQPRPCTAGRGPGAVAAWVRPVAPRLAAIIAGGPAPRAAAVVSTFPLAGHAMAAARRRWDGTVPLITYLTDPAVHACWVAPGTDLYLTGWAGTAGQLWRHGPTPVRVIDPLVRGEFVADPGSGARARRRHALPPGRLALVMSGSWGVGNLEATVRDVLDAGGPAPVVVCGRNHRLHARLAGIPGVTALGWVTDMAAVMNACEVAVLNSGGLTLAEASTVGLPVLHYRPLAGQGQANAAIAEHAGIARWPRTPAALAAALRDPPRWNPRPPTATADPVTEIIATTHRTRAKVWPPASRAAPAAAWHSTRRAVSPAAEVGDG